MPYQFTCSFCGTARTRSNPIIERAYCDMTCLRASRRRKHLPVMVSDDGFYARIPLVDQAGNIKAHAIIDATDAEWAGQWAWAIDKDGYAVRFEWDDGQTRAIMLHRELLGLKQGDGIKGDHIDRNRLNNRRSNLRPAAKFGNAQNVTGHRGSTSRYRGVSWEKHVGKWRAGIKLDGKARNLGYFATEEEAAEVARAARARLMPYAID